MTTYEAIVKLLKDAKNTSDLITDVRELPDNTILLDCNFARAATLTVRDKTIYIDADEQLKSQLDQLLYKLLKRR